MVKNNSIIVQTAHFTLQLAFQNIKMYQKQKLDIVFILSLLLQK